MEKQGIFQRRSSTIECLRISLNNLFVCLEILEFRSTGFRDALVGCQQGQAEASALPSKRASKAVILQAWMF